MTNEYKPSIEFKPSISAMVPDGWLTKESTTLLAPDGKANVIASGEPLAPEIDSQQYAEIQGELLREEFPGYREFHFGPTRVFGGRQGYMRRFEWHPPKGEPVIQLQLYYAEKGRGFTATATTPSANIEDFELSLRQILGELRID